MGLAGSRGGLEPRLRQVRAIRGRLEDGRPEVGQLALVKEEVLDLLKVEGRLTDRC